MKPGLEEKKKKKAEEEATCRQRTRQVHVQVHIDIFVIYLANYPHSVFSLFWRENFFMG